ncbi:MAG TPA: 5-oxoprolinase subunit PxpA [Hyphomicrobiaceae bacterium]|nr:5-oxoprolinase subunit PxpA [Hyphomicrobiaceae bacterium]
MAGNSEININCDMAESFGAYEIGQDDALLDLVGSANVACGFHAGDPTVMRNFARKAHAAGISIGAHPGFLDLQGFGRRQIAMSGDDVETMVSYQIGALQALARCAGMSVTHVKAHGALANMAAVDRAYADALSRAVLAVDARLIHIVLYGSEMQKSAEDLGLRFAREGYADRRYADDGNLAARRLEGSVIACPEAARTQAVRMARDGEIETITGKLLTVDIDTICIHGDQPFAVPVATAVKAGLQDAGIEVLPLDKMRRFEMPEAKFRVAE